MGQAKALVRARTKAAQKKHVWTMHDQDYFRVWKAIEKARGRIVPGQVCEEFRCPICGGPAFVFCREKNIGRDYVGGCEAKCFDCWE
jgi:hypothetical protein